jgi:replicative DNA helicase
MIQQNAITAEHFIGYRDEFDFIMDHHKRYGNVPDTVTFLKEFRDFGVTEVTETDRYLIETLQEEYLYSLMVPFVHKIADTVKRDANDAVKFAKSELERLSKLSAVFQSGYDIVRNAKERHNDYEGRLSREGLLGITTGIDELDKITHGWLPGEDFVIILGRTNEGKSWLLLFFLVIAWLDGKRVLLYSGEMGHTIVGYRFDTLNKHFSNEALMQGESDLGDSRNPTDYRKYLEDLAKSTVPFVVVTPQDLGGKRATVPVINQLIELYKPDIVGVDQLSLVEDARASKGQQERTSYTHVAEDLYLSSEKYGVPILAPSQANREAEKEKKSEDGSSKTPELHQAAESDGVVQNATRVVSMRYGESTLKISVKKNRYGKRNQELLLLWDIDRGIIKPFLAVSTNKEGVATSTKKLVEGVDLF